MKGGRMKKLFGIAILFSLVWMLHAYAATVFIPKNLSGSSGSKVQIPINVDNSTGIVGFQFKITFDASVLRAQSVEAGSLTSGWLLQSNTQVSGEVSIIGVNQELTGLSGQAGSLVLINFDVIGEQGTSTELSFASLKITDETGNAIPFTSENGSFTVTQAAQPASVSGTISYSGIKTGTINIGLFTSPDFSGAPAYGTSIQSPGNYQVTGINPGTYYAAAFMDSNGSGQYDPDVDPVGQYSQNPIILSAGQSKTGVNITLQDPVVPKVATPVFSPASGTTFTDQLQVTISCSTVGATIRYTTDGSDPTEGSTAYTGAITITQTTTIKAKAFKAGMTPSDTASATYTKVQPGSERQVDIPDDIEGAAGASIEIPVNIDNAQDVAGFQFTITYDPTILQAIDAKAGSLTQGWLITANKQVAGEIRVAGADGSLQGLSGGSGSLCILQMTVKPDAAVSSASQLLFTESKLTDKEAKIIPVVATGGKVTVIQQGAKVATPVFSPASGTTFTDTLVVTITCATVGAEIRYSTNGDDPNEACALYTGPITIFGSTLFKARAFKPGCTPSDIAESWYEKLYFSITGKVAISGGEKKVTDVEIKLTGKEERSTHPDEDGNYGFFELQAGEYTVTAVLDGYRFHPEKYEYKPLNSNKENQDFTGAFIETKYTISGKVTLQPSGNVTQVKLRLVGGGLTKETNPDSNGEYQITDIPKGNYVLTAELEGYTFAPPAIGYLPLNSDKQNQDFAGTQQTGGDFSIIPETDSILFVLDEDLLDETSLNIKVESINGFSKPVNLSVETLPNFDGTILFDTQIVTPTSESTMHILISGLTEPNYYSLLAKGTSEGIERSAEIKMTAASHLFITEIIAAAGEEITIPVIITNARRLGGFQFVFEYDDQKLEILGVEKDFITRDFLLQNQSQGPGKLEILGVSTTLLERQMNLGGGRGNLLNIKARIKDSPGDGTTLAISEPLFITYDCNEIPIVFSNGVIKEGKKGDLNRDGRIDTADLLVLANLILNKGYDVLGDMNNDGKLNVIDSVMLMKVVLAAMM